ncbi:MAG: hypothetical protein EOO10_23295 [Chitinophagaceae bacterium]|nr:MAG: hypothetical protein EOO10_23295 [Chitinophagaceae bacterium]
MNHSISLSEAIDMTTRYRNNRETVLQTGYRNIALLPICETFDKAAFESLLSAPGCAFVRIYYGMDADLKMHAIIVAADAEGQDLLPTQGLTEDDDDFEILDRANRCPELCPPESALNS